MFQLSVWKGSRVWTWKSCVSEFPGRLIQGNSGSVEIAGGQRTQCRGWTSFCQAFPPKAERFRRRAADNELAATRSKHPTKWMTEVGSIPTPGSSIQTCRAITRRGNCREHHPFRVSRLRPRTNLKCYRVGYYSETN